MCYHECTFLKYEILFETRQIYKYEKKYQCLESTCNIFSMASYDSKSIFHLNINCVYMKMCYNIIWFYIISIFYIKCYVNENTLINKKMKICHIHLLVIKIPMNSNVLLIHQIYSSNSPKIFDLCTSPRRMVYQNFICWNVCIYYLPCWYQNVLYIFFWYVYYCPNFNNLP